MPKSRKRKKKLPPAGPPRYRRNPFFTPKINALLDEMTKDERLSSVERVWCSVARASWGNWSDYAIVIDKEPLPAEHDFNPATDARMPSDLDPWPNMLSVERGGPCPLCYRRRSSQDGIPDDWPFHNECAIALYAYDAMACACLGSQAQWAFDKRPEALRRIAKSYDVARGIGDWSVKGASA